MRDLEHDELATSAAGLMCYQAGGSVLHGLEATK